MDQKVKNWPYKYIASARAMGREKVPVFSAAGDGRRGAPRPCAPLRYGDLYWHVESAMTYRVVLLFSINFSFLFKSGNKLSE
jgi:hypothetical protein